MRIKAPKDATRSEVATALKPFFPNSNREERRRMVREAKSSGKGFTRPLMCEHERKRKR